MDKLSLHPARVKTDKDSSKALTYHHLRNRLHSKEGIIIVESPKVIFTAFEARLQPLSLLCESRHITVFKLPWAWLDTSMDNLHDFGLKTVAMTLRHDSIALDNKRLLDEPHLAVVMGTEGVASTRSMSQLPQSSHAGC